MLKVLYLPIGRQHGTENAFKELGCDLRVLDFLAENRSTLASTFLSIIKDFQPDLCHMQLQMTHAISPETIVKAKQLSPNTVFSNWSGDIRREPSNYFIEISKVINFSLLSNIGQIDLYKKHGGRNIYYWQTGFDHKCFFPKNNKSFNYDIVFAGNTYGNIFPDAHLRSKIVSELKNQFGDRAGIFGNGYPQEYKARSVDIREMNDIYNSSLTVLSVSNFNDEAHYFSDRLVIAMASGRPCICYRFPGWESYFKDKQDILIANNIQDIISHVNYCKQNTDNANLIGHNGGQLMKHEHTFMSRVIELLELTGTIGLL